VLHMGRKVCQPCTLVQCEVRGQGNVCEVYEYSVGERSASKGTVVWGSDNVLCPMHTDCRNDADSSCYICVGMNAMYLNTSMLVRKKNVS